MWTADISRSAAAITANNFTSCVLQWNSSNDIKVDFSLRTLMFCSSSQLMWHFFTGIFRFLFLSAFNLYPHFAVHHGGGGVWGGGSIMCPLTQRNSHFSADFEWVLSCNGPTHPHFFSLQKMGNDKSAEAILSLFHYLFSQYVLITYYLPLAVIIIYIFFWINRDKWNPPSLSATSAQTCSFR